jgi:MFS family permease
MKPKDIFLLAYTLSLIGASSLEFGLLWFFVADYQTEMSAFYFSQAVGSIFGSSVLAICFDVFMRRRVVFGVFCGYLVTALLILLLSSLEQLLLWNLVFLTFFLGSFAAVLKSSISFFVASSYLAADRGIGSSFISKFMATMNFGLFAGASLSGVLYSEFGIIGCAILAITFSTPLFAHYMSFFGSEEISQSRLSVGFQTIFFDFIGSYRLLGRSRLLFGSALSVGVVNMVGSVFPGVIGLSFKKWFDSPEKVASIAIGFAVLSNIVVTWFIDSKSISSIRTNLIIPISLLPSALAMLVHWFFPSPFSLVLVYFLFCVGGSFRNVMSGTIRARWSDRSTSGRVNWAYFSILNLGQALGSFVVVQTFSVDSAIVSPVVIACFFIASALSFALLPNRAFASSLR